MVGYALNNGYQMVIAVDKNTILQPINVEGELVLNSTLIYYNPETGLFKTFSYKYFELYYYIIVYSSTGRKDAYLNKTRIFYVAPTSNSYIVDKYRFYKYSILRIDVDVVQTYQCYDSIFYNCRLQYENVRGRYKSYTSISYPMYNAVLITLRDSRNTIVSIPIYRQSYVFGYSTPPGAEANSFKSIMRIGMFDYYLLINVWRW